MLLIAGTNDHVVPKAVVEAEKKYHGPAMVDLKIFEGRTHGIIIQTGCEEVAGLALAWVEKKTKEVM